MEALIASQVERAVRDLIVAEQTNLGVEITTPVVYPDGDVVTVVVERASDSFLVHDAGFASMRLSESGIHLSRVAARRLKENCARYKCNFSQGRVSAKADMESLGIVISLVANAARTVGDYALEMRRQAEADFRQILSEALREIFGARIRENEEIRGTSGRRYRVSAIVLDTKEDQPVNVVSAVANRQGVPYSFAMLYDLQEVYRGVEGDSVYDENADIRAEDRLLLGSVGRVFSFSEARSRFREIMGASAGNS